jgi:hypothetical protein
MGSVLNHKYLFVPEFCIASLMIIRIKRVYDDPKEDTVLEY